VRICFRLADNLPGLFSPVSPSINVTQAPNLIVPAEQFDTSITSAPEFERSWEE